MKGYLNFKIFTTSISIPKYGKAESLNAAVALGIIVDNYRRG